MRKLSTDEENNIYGGMAVAAGISLFLQVLYTGTAIFKMLTSDSGSINTDSKGTDFKWQDNKGTKNSWISPAVYGY